MRNRVAALLVGVAFGTGCYAQSVISAHSGTVHYVEGTVYLENKLVELKFGQFPDLKNDQQLRTEEGRAEILLTPGAILRVAENSSIRMVSNSLENTKVEVLGGSAMLECDELLKDNGITLLYKSDSMLIAKKGLYRIDSDPARFRVFDGEAIVKGETSQLTLSKGKETALSGVLMAEKFDVKDNDDLYRWANRRAEYLSMANPSTARSLRDSGSGWSTPGWSFNPWFGMYTFVPFGGMAYSPFGYGFWSPFNVGQFYNYYGNGYYGYNGYGGGGGGGATTTRNGGAGTGVSTSSSVGRASSSNSGFGGFSGFGGTGSRAGGGGGFSGGGGSTGGGGGMASGGGHAGGGSAGGGHGH